MLNRNHREAHVPLSETNHYNHRWNSIPYIKKPLTSCHKLIAPYSSIGYIFPIDNPYSLIIPSREREREKIPIPFAAKKLHTRSLEHLVGNRTISKIESNQSGNCVIVRVPVGKGGGVQHGGTSSADEYTHQGALNEKLHRERPVCPPHPSRHSSGCQEQRERERESGRASVCIRSVSTGRNATRIRR